MSINRKRFLQNTGLAVGGGSLGFLARELLGRWYVAGVSSTPPVVRTVVVPRAPEPAPAPTVAAPPQGEASFSQAGEDLVVKFTCHFLGISHFTYLDVGANDPVELNNTYFFYRMGYRGVLVEPNVSYCDKLRAVRPRDTTLAAGIGVTATREADYYIMTHPALNTFSKEEVDHQAKASKGAISVKEVIKMPLLNINDVMIEHFHGAPTFLSVDTEGLDLAILKSIDYKRFRPKIICAETLVSSTTKTRPEIPEFMATQGYVDRGGSFVNTIFIDSKIL
jgi:FkbM family methyltransferase